MMLFMFFPLFFIGFLVYLVNGLQPAGTKRSRRNFKNHKNDLKNGTHRDMDLDYIPNTTESVPDEKITGKIFRLAVLHEGRLTLSDIVIETGFNLQEADKFMDTLIDGQHVQIEVDDKGFIVYDFPEIIARLKQN